MARVRVDSPYVFYKCPGCNDEHNVRIADSGPGPKWSWNGNADRPTITPSVNYTDRKCHHHIKDGQIQFLNDSTHQLAGKTVDLPEYKEIPMSDETKPDVGETIAPSGETKVANPETEGGPGETSTLNVVAREPVTSHIHPEGMTNTEAVAIVTAPAGNTINVSNPAAAVEFGKAGYIPEGVIICDRHSNQVWPLPVVPEEPPSAASPSVSATPRIKPPAIVGPNQAPQAPQPPEPTTPPHVSVEAKPTGKPAAS